MPGVVELFGRGSVEDRLTEPGPVAGADRLTVQGRCNAGAEPALASDRLVDQAENRFAPMKQCDLRAEG
ncbi:hypothetical protein D9M69_635730 [compost metagenome]